MSYRDTATALAQRAPGNFIGVALYVPIGDLPVRWDAVALMSLPALKDWYEEIAGAPTLYYYLAAFDKTQSSSPVAETIAPPKPGDPGWPGFVRLRQYGYQWRPNPFGAALEKTRSTVSGEPHKHGGISAFQVILVGVAIYSATQLRQIRNQLKIRSHAAVVG